MTGHNSDWEKSQRRRWMRHDAQRWIRPDAHRWLSPGIERVLGLPILDRKYSEDQPRVPAGQEGAGRWTSGGDSPSDFDAIYESALQFAKQNARIAIAGPGNYQRCLDICYPLLERSQRPGSDKNVSDFQKCMNACVRGLRWR